MIIDKISFTGADDKVDIQNLVDLQKQYPIIEWAILYFPEREALARNPSLQWRQRFYNAKLQSAMHLCGSGINQFADGYLPLVEEVQNYQRIQINLKPRWASTELVNALIERCKQFPHIQFITQYNEDNMPYVPLWDKLVNHAYLFDASLGKGVSPPTWPQPIAHKDCGYAGGLSPQNISQELVKINYAVNSLFFSHKIWIDMESGVRTDDQFDLEKIKSILASIL